MYFQNKLITNLNSGNGIEYLKNFLFYISPLPKKYQKTIVLKFFNFNHSDILSSLFCNFHNNPVDFLKITTQYQEMNQGTALLYLTFSPLIKQKKENIFEFFDKLENTEYMLGFKGRKIDNFHPYFKEYLSKKSISNNLKNFT